MNDKQFASIYSFKVKKIDGSEQILKAYKNKVLLIVNTASECGFTPQYKDLQLLKEAINHPDFEILAFPTNDFGKQEPLEGEALGAFCTKNFGVEFPVFDKIRVRGPHAHPLFNYLSEKELNGVISSKPRWNFHKYLVNREGKVVDYFYPFTKPLNSKVKKKIAKLLAEK